MAKEAVISTEDSVYILQSGMNIYVKTADICSLFGFSNQWAGQLTSQGILNKTKTPQGNLYNLVNSVKSYIESIENKVSKTEDEKKIEKAKSAAELKLKAAKASIAQLQADELKGRMHRSEDVERLTQDMCYTIRNMLLGMPGRLAVDVANCDSAEECSVIIRDAVNAILEELSNYQYDPKKYEELVREREDMDDKPQDDDE